MSNPNNDDVEQSVTTALYNLIVAETAIAGPNPTGRLQACADVRKSAHLWTERLPAIGVQSEGYEESDESTSSHILRIRFRIIACANSVKSSTKPANLDDAWATLQPLLSDGSGNGLGPLLRDPANRTLGLGSRVIRSKISKLHRRATMDEGNPPQVLAYGEYLFDVWATTYIGR